MFSEEDMKALVKSGKLKINKNSVTKSFPKEWRESPKYRNIKTVVDEITFDSQLEAKRYKLLKTLEKTGNIFDLKLQVPFELQPAFVTITGEKIRAIKYVADFVYINKSGVKVVEDTKGVRTKEYKIKKKMFLYKYSDVIFLEIR